MFENKSNNYYSSVKEEYSILKNGAGIFPVHGTSIIKLIGKETLDFIHRVSTNSVADLQLDEKKNTLFLNEKGRFIDKTSLLNLGEFYFIIGSPDKDKRLFSWINKFIIMEDIKTQDVSEEYLLINVSGPQSESYLMLLIGDEITGLNSDNIINTHADGFNFYLFREEYNGSKNFRILIDKNRSSEFIEYMLQNKSVFDVALIGEEAHEIYRVENGIPSYPNEINFNSNPYETNLINYVNFSKGCYIGQEVIARLDTYDKIQRSMTGIILDDEIETNGTVTLFDEDKNDVGIVTSMVKSELLKKTIGLGLIRKKAVVENGKIFAGSNNGKINVTLSELPFKR